MSLIMFDGFDDNLLTKNKWTANQNMAQTASGRNGDGAHFDHQSGSPAQLERSLNASEEDDVIVIGFAMNRANVHPTSVKPILEFRSDGGATSHVVMYGRDEDEGSGLQFRRGIGGAVLGTCPFGQAQWRYLEIKIKLHDATGYLVVHLDGQEVLNNDNIDTKNGGTKTVFDNIMFLVERQSATIPVLYIDDLYLLNEQGARNNDFLNDCRVENLLPNANGTYSQFDSTPGGDNYAAVDENPPSDADYVESDTGGHDDSYNFPALSGVGAVAGVQVHLYGTVDDAGTRGVKALTRQGGADSLGDEKTFNATPQTHTQMWEDNPDDAAQWVVADVDGAEFGLEVV